MFTIIEGCTNAVRQVALASVGWRRMFVGPQYETCFMSLFWRLEFWGVCCLLFFLWINFVTRFFNINACNVRGVTRFNKPPLFLQSTNPNPPLSSYVTDWAEIKLMLSNVCLGYWNLFELQVHQARSATLPLLRNILNVRQGTGI
jgi:hypothetical protein